MRYFLVGLLVCTAGYAFLAPGDSGVTLNPIRLIPKVFDWGYKPEAGSIVNYGAIPQTWEDPIPIGLNQFFLIEFQITNFN